VDRWVFSYNPNAASTSYNNPTLMADDVTRVRDSALSAGIRLLNEVAPPFVGVSSTEMGWAGERIIWKVTATPRASN